MNWLLVLVAAAGVLAGPVVAGVVAPGLMTQVAEQGIAVKHHHFAFDQSYPVHHGDADYVVTLRDGDLYEMPLTTQVVLRGAVAPPPDDAELRFALHRVAQTFHLPVLGYEVAREGDDVTLKATLPAGVLAELDPHYRAMLAQYERNA
jgi:hypothetical protein